MSEPALTSVADAPSTTETPDPRRWLILGVIAIAQLMIVLDSSIMNIALPSAAKDLDIASADLQWAITAYTLAFGGLLLLGGRIADYLGRKTHVRHRPGRLRRSPPASAAPRRPRACSSLRARCRARSPRCSRPPRSRSSR